MVSSSVRSIVFFFRWLTSSGSLFRGSRLLAEDQGDPREAMSPKYKHRV